MSATRTTQTPSTTSAAATGCSCRPKDRRCCCCRRWRSTRGPPREGSTFWGARYDPPRRGRESERPARESAHTALEGGVMNRVWLGALLGVTVGVAAAALLGAFCARFALGFFATTARLPLPPIWAGIVVGLLTSMPDAIITKT